MTSSTRSSWWRSAGGQLVVTSGVTVVFEACMGHQLEYIKIVRQTTLAPYWSIVCDIVRPRGIIGLWDGFVPWGVVQALTKGAVFGWAHNMLRRGLSGVDGVSANVKDTLAGAGAGGIQGLVLSPTLLLKTRVMTEPVAITSPWQAFWESFRIGFRVVRNEGVASLMKGAPTFAAKRVGDWGSRYAFTNAVEAEISKRKKLDYYDRIAASLVGGMASAACTIPVDVMVANIQTATAAGQRVSFAGAFAETYKKNGFDGVLGFATRGFLPRSIHVTLTTVVVKTGTAYVQDRLDPPPSSSS
ncbi:hypothetical protein CTAYLR_002964 [Chrysophaeum taylorii]|uniref:Mitochondrial carrier protein n=1 Tax=Chrysophaeum taylorii TaxID=2483200 RepID=A0AAD7XGF3_9STRA|nr:hypothetical protein CTAYLR_002964 [Chrysophaeum taylorii]